MVEAEGEKKDQISDNMGSDSDSDADKEAEMEPIEKAKALMAAVKAGNLADAQMYINMRADVNYEENGWTPLLWAACNGNEDIVRLLIRNNAHLMYKEAEETQQDQADGNDDEKEDNFKKVPDPAKTGRYTPMHWASYHGHHKVVWILMKENMSPLVKDMHGNNCIHQAAANS